MNSFEGLINTEIGVHFSPFSLSKKTKVTSANTTYDINHLATHKNAMAHRSQLIYPSQAPASIGSQPVCLSSFSCCSSCCIWIWIGNCNISGREGPMAADTFHFHATEKCQLSELRAPGCLCRVCLHVKFSFHWNRQILTKNFVAINAACWLLPAAGDCDKWAWHVDIPESNRWKLFAWQWKWHCESLQKSESHN